MLHRRRAGTGRGGRLAHSGPQPASATGRAAGGPLRGASAPRHRPVSAVETAPPVRRRGGRAGHRGPLMQGGGGIDPGGAGASRRGSAVLLSAPGLVEAGAVSAGRALSSRRRDVGPLHVPDTRRAATALSQLPRPRPFRLAPLIVFLPSPPAGERREKTAGCLQTETARFVFAGRCPLL